MTSAATTQLNPTDPLYPAARLRHYATPVSLAALGNIGLLEGNLLGLFCSSRCPASLLLPAYDTAAALAAAGVAVVSGFHTPPEQGCLRLLLQGHQPLVICPARRIEGMRLPTSWRSAFDAGRLLLLSPFEQQHKRITAETAEQRNRFVAALADELLVIHAHPSGKTEQLCREALAWGKTVHTLPDPANSNLLALGASEYQLPTKAQERKDE